VVTIGLRSTATIMFGHVDGYEHWARHLLRLLELQKRTNGFTEFVPLSFVHMQAPIYLKGIARKGPSFTCRAVIIAAGTFLRGRMHVGKVITPGGRFAEPASLALADELENLGFELMGRFREKNTKSY